ncbi:MAG: alpha/beta hydrolase [Candidatus Babeliales bacterium]
MNVIYRYFHAHSLLLAGMLTLTAHADSFFDTPGTKQTSYVYCPGLLGSPVVMGRYCPSFMAPTHEEITWEHGGHVIDHPYSAVTFAEIVTEKPRFCYNPLTWPTNGFRSIAYPIAKAIGKKRYGLQITEHEHTATSIAHYFFDISAINIGQDHDVELLNTTLTQHRLCHPHTHIVLYGDSRGAATIINFLGLDYDYTNIKAVVLEGIFDSIDHLLTHYRASKIPGMKRALHATLKACAGTYKEDGVFPRDTITKIPAHIPILFVTSLNDEIVPYQCTMRLYNTIQERPNAHLLVLKKANHMDYMYHEKERYESVVHAFYKEYGVAYNTQKAKRGTKTFATTRPTKDYLRTTYHLHDACCAQI